MWSNRIKEIRLRTGLSQSKLANKIGIPNTLLSDLERGIFKPYPKLRRRIAEGLGVPEEELFPPEEN